MYATFTSSFLMAWLVLSHVSADVVAGQFKTLNKSGDGKTSIVTLDNVDDEWRTKAMEKLKGVVLNDGGGGGDSLEQTEETRRELNARRHLADDCVAFVNGSAFNMVNVTSCNLKSTTTIEDGETVRVRGRDDLDHPELMRGGVGNGQTPVSFRHFIMNGASFLTLMNLKLSGAYVGSAGGYVYRNSNNRESVCGYCQYYSNTCCGRCLSPSCYHVYCQNACNDGHKGGVLRINGASTIILIDLIFAANTAYSSTGNIFSAYQSSAKLYLMNMPIPTQMVGITPVYKCDAAPTNFCSEVYDYATCALDSTSESKRVYCTCQAGSYGTCSTSTGTTANVGSCQACIPGRYSTSGPSQTSISDFFN